MHALNLRHNEVRLPMKEDFADDRVLRDLFEMDHPSLLEQFTGGVHVREFLNVEFPQVIERRADLVARLEDESIFHLEIQGQNDKRIAYRAGMYFLLIAQRYQRPIKQVVLYVGKQKMRMNPKLDEGAMKFSVQLIDIREIDAGMLLRSGSAGDLVLSMLAKGGTERLAEIAQRAAALGDRERARVLTQLILLSGLRELSGQLRMELKGMSSMQIDFRKNEILREVWDEVMAEGLAEGLAEGKAQGEAVGMAKMLQGMLHAKFGRVPKWADDRLGKANKAQIERWSKKFVNAQTLEGVIGKK
jgi:predicted transposase YdaD